jgi:hypothetical protein
LGLLLLWLSKITIGTPASANTTAVCEPIKPSPPVIKMGRVMPKKPGKVVVNKNLSNYRLQGGASL